MCSGLRTIYWPLLGRYQPALQIIFLELKVSSFVVIRKEDGVAVFETFNHEIVKKLNKEKYEAIPIMKYLCDLNKKIKDEACRKMNQSCKR